MAICADLLLRGFHVYRNVVQNSGVDLVALKGEEFYKIEVKTAKCCKSGRLVWTKPRHNNFDIVAGYSIDTKQVAYEPALE